jgi:hypothetical protein
MCPDCKAMAEEMGVLKERLMEQQRQLVRYDAMLQEGKLRDLGQLPNNGVAPMMVIEAREQIPNEHLQRHLLREGRQAAERLIKNATDRLRASLLIELAKHIRFAESRADIITGNTDVVAWMAIDSRGQ